MRGVGKIRQEEIHDICEAFVGQWRSGNRPSIEDCLAEASESLRSELLAELLHEELHERQRIGEKATVDEYFSRFPQDRDTVANVLSATAPVDPLASTFSLANAQHDSTLAPSPAQADRVGTAQLEIPGYEIQGVLGRGGMGIVYRALDRRLNRVVAIKMVLNPGGASALTRFQAEAEAVARLKHPHIVEIYSQGESVGRPYSVMEYVAGGSLRRRLDSGPLAVAKAVRLVALLSRALEAAHQARIVHRDLKPSNILLADEESPKVADFGLAKLLDLGQQQTLTGEILGTPAYMAPEQAQGDSRHVGPAADIYSLGAILYETLSGVAPFRAPTPYQILQQVIHAEPVPLRDLQPDVPLDLDTICLKCLSKEPGRRYESAAALADELERFERGEPIAARPVSDVEKAWRWSLRNPALAKAVITAALCLLAGTITSSYLAYRASQSASEASRNAHSFQQAKSLSDRRLYAAQTNLVHQWISNGQVKSAVNLLESLRPDDAKGQDSRDWEWYFLVRRCNAAQFELRAHQGGVSSVACSANGRWIASGGDEGGLALWDLASGTLLRKWVAHDGAVNSITFSPDDRLLVSTGQDANAFVWDVESGGAITTYLRHGLPIHHALFVSPQLVATTAEDLFVRVWDARTGRDRTSLTAQPQRRRYHQLAISDRQRFLAALGNEGLAIWDHSARPRRILPGGQRMAFAPHGRQLAVVRATDDYLANTVVVLDPLQGTELFRLRGHKSEISAVSFSPDGARIATAGGRDHTVRIWRSSDGQFEQTLIGHEDEVRDVVFSADGRQVISASKDGVVRVWSARPGGDVPTLGPHATPVSRIEFSRDGEEVLTVADYEPRLWNVSSAQLVRTFGKHNFKLEPPRGERVGRLTSVTTHEGHTAPLRAAAWSPDNRLVASCENTGKLLLWDAATGQIEVQAELGQTPRSIAWFPDGSRLFVTLVNGSWLVWNASDQAIESNAPNGDLHVAAGTFRPGTLEMLTASNTGALHSWSPIATGIAAPLLTSSEPISVIAADRDGDRFAIGEVGGTIRVGSLRRRKWLLTCQGHAGSINHLSFSPGGKRLLSIGGSTMTRTLKFWDLSSGQDVLTLNGPYETAAISPDGRRIAVANFERNTVEILDSTLSDHARGRSERSASDSPTVASGPSAGHAPDVHGDSVPLPALRVLAHGRADVIPFDHLKSAKTAPPLLRPSEGDVFVFALVSIPLHSLVATPEEYAKLQAQGTKSMVVAREQTIVQNCRRFSLVLDGGQKSPIRWQADWERNLRSTRFFLGLPIVSRMQPIPASERCCILLAGLVPAADIAKVRAIQIDDQPPVSLGTDVIEAKDFDLTRLAEDGYQRAKEGQVELAQFEASLIGAAASSDSVATYNAACILAQCAVAIGRDEQLPVDERQQQSDEFIERAIAMLRYAIELGFEDGAHLAVDDDLTLLRPHPDFKALLQQLPLPTPLPQQLSPSPR